VTHTADVEVKREMMGLVNSPEALEKGIERRIVPIRIRAKNPPAKTRVEENGLDCLGISVKASLRPRPLGNLKTRFSF
jgi:hypothetical protein